MTTNEPIREPGYRGALAPREDHLARPWILGVMAAFVLIIVLSVLGIPSRFIPDPTPLPLPSVPLPSATFEELPSGSGDTGEDPSPSESASGSPSPTPSN